MATAKKEKSELIAVSAFARMVHVDESTVREYIRSGRFSTKAVKPNEKGINKMVGSVALREWKAFGGGLDKANKLQPKPKPGNPKKEPEKPGLNSGESEGKEVEEDENAESEPGVPNINKSKARTEFYKSQSAELEYKELLGDLIRKKDVEDQLFEFGNEIKKTLMSIPDLVVDKVMATKSRAIAHECIRAEIEAVLLKLTESVKIEKKRGR